MAVIRVVFLVTVDEAILVVIKYNEWPAAAPASENHSGNDLLGRYFRHK